MAAEPQPGKIRIDKWVWFARIVKTRSKAQSLIKAGKVRVNSEKTLSPRQNLKIGDVLTVTLDRQIKVLKVAAPGQRRGPAEEAQMLYEDLSPPVPMRDRDNPAPILHASREASTGRPTKKEQRQPKKGQRQPKKGNANRNTKTKQGCSASVRNSAVFWCGTPP